MHFLAPTVYGLHTFYAFFIRTQFLKKIGALAPTTTPTPAPRVRPCLHYDLIFGAAVTQWNPMGAEQIIS